MYVLTGSIVIKRVDPFRSHGLVAIGSEVPILKLSMQKGISDHKRCSVKSSQLTRSYMFFHPYNAHDPTAQAPPLNPVV